MKNTIATLDWMRCWRDYSDEWISSPFVTSQGLQCPSVLLTAYGASLHLIFPNPMQITSLNGQVRVEPDRILHDPYGAGWLFEGVEASGTDIQTGLLSGEKARSWMEDEVRRVNGPNPPPWAMPAGRTG